MANKPIRYCRVTWTRCYEPRCTEHRRCAVRDGDTSSPFYDYESSDGAAPRGACPSDEKGAKQA